MDSTDDVLASFQAVVTSAQRASRTPSLQVGVRLPDGRRLQLGAPEVTERPFRIGSITKTATAALVVRLLCHAEADLDRPVAGFLPPGQGPWASATLLQLLSHTAGWRAEPAGPWWERHPGRDFAALSASLDDVRRVPVGTYHYSNLGYAVLGAALEHTTGQAYENLLTTSWLTPLGLTRTQLQRPADASTGYSVGLDDDRAHPEPGPDTQAMAPAGQLWSTISDLLTWGEQWLPDSAESVLSGDELSWLLRPRAEVTQPRDRHAYGLGMRLINDGDVPVVGHTGTMPGFQAALFTSQQGTVVAVGANATRGLACVDLVRSLVALAESRPGPALAQAHPVGTPWTPSEPRYTGLTGRWFWGHTGLYAVERSGSLMLHTLPDGDLWGRFEADGAPGGQLRGVQGYLDGEFLKIGSVDPETGLALTLDVASFELTRYPTSAL